jgi:hypothetical protein
MMLSNSIHLLTNNIISFFIAGKYSIVYVYHTTPGVYLKECKSGYNTDNCIPMFIAALFTIAK